MSTTSDIDIDPNYTFVLTLEYGKNYETELYQLEKGWAIRFELGSTLFGYEVKLFTTHHLPDPSHTAMVGGIQWYEVPLSSGSANEHDTFCRFADVQCVEAGPQKFVYFCSDNDTFERPNGSGYFQVLPMLKYGNDDLTCRLQSLECQTVLAKLLGTFDQWEDRLKVTCESGYNVIHITPIQALGCSNSSYSIADQLKFNPQFVPPDAKYGFKDVQELVQKLHKEYRVFTISDVVWNHTARNSPWLLQHPECGFNLENTPHLRPAFVLDRVLAQFSREVANGEYVAVQLPVGRWSWHNLECLRSILLEHILPSANLHELFQVDVNALTSVFESTISGCNGPCNDPLPEKAHLEIIQDQQYARFKSTVDITLAVRLFNRTVDGCSSEVDRRTMCTRRFREALVDLNNKAAAVCWDHLRVAVSALVGHVSYQRVEDNGPKYTDYTDNHPLLPEYFLYRQDPSDWQKEEAVMHTDYAKNILALSGWVMNDNPLCNFAEPPSQVYFRRELVCWGDSVKLRYGKRHSDSPYLWQHMTEYTRQTATVFHGFRLDNCHSTPIHVAEYLLREARKVRPELYVCAELFTQSEAVDNIFVNRLGINALIREAMSAPDVHEQGRLVYRYGGNPVGSFLPSPFRYLTSAVAMAMFFDVTHDNPCPVKTRSAYDSLPTAVMVNSAGCAIGSTRGYDELVPYQIDVVNEKRLYCSWVDGPVTRPGQVNLNTGIIRARRTFNRLHNYVTISEFNEVFVDQKTEDVTVIRRFCPTMMESIIYVLRNCFKPCAVARKVNVPKFDLAGTLETILFECKLTRKKAYSSDDDCVPKRQAKVIDGSDRFIIGLKDYELSMKEDVVPFESEHLETSNVRDKPLTEVELTDLPPSSVVVLSVTLSREARHALMLLQKELTRVNLYMVQVMQKWDVEQYKFEGPELQKIAKGLTLLDINYVLYRSEAEETSDNPSSGAYDVPNFGRLVYCGLQGLMHHLARIRRDNDLGHPLCENLRKGDWMADYVTNRLLAREGTKELGNWFAIIFRMYKEIPHFMKPAYFEVIISSVYNVLCEAMLSNLSRFVHQGSLFLRSLTLSSVAFCGHVKSAPLPWLSKNLKLSSDEAYNRIVLERRATTISAGLPHFAAGLFRNWGRDTFISLRGLLLVTGRYEEARCIILGYAGCLRHGLIPNLLGEGTHARYNCRDAVWWWLLCIKYYVEMVPDGFSILKDPVNRLYVDDNAEPYSKAWEQPLHDTMQEALQVHFRGLKFRERNAGKAIDEHMTDAGFNIEIGVDMQTGFVFGGNKWNCGTWMDKMGSSDKAGNRGVPGSPRDGSAVELVGISFAVISWLDTMYLQKKYPFEGVKRTEGDREIFWEWMTWKVKIAEAFERHYWIPLDEKEPLPAVTDPKLVNVRGIYKDTYKAEQPWEDYRLRPNFLVAVTLAPELFNLDHAEIAIEQAKKELLSRLGMKTLTDRDWSYNGDYINSDDSDDPKRAKGFNYHNGPEWCWPFGYFVRAKLTVARLRRAANPVGWKNTVSEVQQLMGPMWKHLQQSAWFSLPELTNKGGAYCADSCEAQAWSVGCLLEVFYDLDEYERMH
uniref:Glycogen debranching enzyme n=1 Tax=Trichuris muris TaxID=70415 RepID=A0A5S6R4Q9_TRIMR